MLMPEMLASNCCVPPNKRDADPGVTVTLGTETESVVEALNELAVA